MNNSETLFVALSEQLTAFSTFELYGTGQVAEYLATVENVVGPTILCDLLEAYSKIQDLGGEAFHTALREEILSDECYGPVARSLIKMWFCGTWYQLPSAWTDKFGQSLANSTFVVSANAYKEGLMWPTIGSHPMGAKAPGYASWTKAPEIPEIETSIIEQTS
ncbi:hypothetical protein [Persicobacter diffluens]|uniref:Membrane bound FAD containing D-sorbitol dehydrogenase n=1 Tax=Persicobacter diffluens TaxID=981 RepID=A0AAN5AMA7_9BACT|nr:hypothetical protein PEDI_41790 [Persicobacter diffluens]